ncbi:hypothetical protein B0T22DRAFT_531440 [Podospora appendiculata]|uniref:Uncharacterized protein n=1 Tax=Podospora appendiculata TaxID=314037 RepID=A0AAE1C723_9PEZI|nr:hypothetical protein B0T22DRAFT_531440 [Podospora appendiculata]
MGTRISLPFKTNWMDPTFGVPLRQPYAGSVPRRASIGGSVDRWFYPSEIANDLQGVDLPAHFIGETLACAWEYARCVIPEYTNWTRYIAFTRIIVVGIVAEFRGSLVDIMASSHVLGYDLDALLATVFGGTPIHEAMAREFRAFVLITADKTSARRHDSELFHRCVNAIAAGPRTWFRLRDCDALARFSVGAALACNDHDDTWFSEPELEVLTELCDTMYDAVAYYKHRAKGEINSTFAYAGADLRAAAWLTLGNPETEIVIDQARQNFKLWNRVDGAAVAEQGNVAWSPAAAERYADAVGRSDSLMFEGLAELLEASETGSCGTCQYKGSYGSEIKGQAEWQSYIQGFPARAAEVFPSLSQQPLVVPVDE